jgi:hypothetical protein
MLEVVGQPPHEVYAGDVEYRTPGGWKIKVFNDCGDWDYFDSIETPNGRLIDFDELPEEIRNYRPSDKVRDVAYHWEPHGYSEPPPTMAETVAAMIKLGCATGSWAAMLRSMTSQQLRMNFQRCLYNLIEAAALPGHPGLKDSVCRLAKITALWTVFEKSRGAVSKRQEREDRLRGLGYDEPSEDERRDNLSRNVALLDSKNERS